MMLQDRHEAGRLLARELQRFADRPDVIVLGLPRGGVPVAYEVATALNVPLDVFVVRKLGLPGREEFAVGAIASGGLRVLNVPFIRFNGASEDDLSDALERESKELDRRERVYREGRRLPNLFGRTVILVDDGLATGASMQAAVMALKKAQPDRIVVAVPVAPKETRDALRAIADEIVCALPSDPFRAAGLRYRDFERTSDEEVRKLLEDARTQSAEPALAG